MKESPHSIQDFGKDTFQHFDLGLQASRIVREWIYFVINYLALENQQRLGLNVCIFSEQYGMWTVPWAALIIQV